jgi:predicted Fe-Mo cluster-binding NifX family protein
MKVAIASDDQKTISHHFGRAAGFVVYEIKDGKAGGSEYRQNIGKSKGECGTCDHGAMIKNVADCKFVISHGMGQSIYNDLTAKGIIPLVTDEDSVDTALEKFMGESLINRLDRLH